MGALVERIGDKLNRKGLGSNFKTALKNKDYDAALAEYNKQSERGKNITAALAESGEYSDGGGGWKHSYSSHLYTDKQGQEDRQWFFNEKSKRESQAVVEKAMVNVAEPEQKPMSSETREGEQDVIRKKKGTETILANDRRKLGITGATGVRLGINGLGAL